ncbi:hypothetical protein GCM10022197_41830 [Microlunatus spumicola]|uniref:Uncharacterized protein n=1 Tax=Microlunatus spumicola TaxID=81499 RepID=A0ABP6YC55_9ACTN
MTIHSSIACSITLPKVGQRRVDRVWPVPLTTRHVWARLDGTPHAAPVQGYVLEWRRHSYRWFASVVTVALDEHGRPRAEVRWVDVDRLTPVRSDPNNGGRVRHLG